MLKIYYKVTLWLHCSYHVHHQNTCIYWWGWRGGRKTFISDAKLVNAFEINVRDFFTIFYKNKIDMLYIYISVTNLLNLTECPFRMNEHYNLKPCYGCLLFINICSLMFQNRLQMVEEHLRFILCTKYLNNKFQN
jgi:hypothetical protein